MNNQNEPLCDHGHPGRTTVLGNGGRLPSPSAHVVTPPPLPSPPHLLFDVAFISPFLDGSDPLDGSDSVRVVRRHDQLENVPPT